MEAEFLLLLFLWQTNKRKEEARRKKSLNPRSLVHNKSRKALKLSPFLPSIHRGLMRFISCYLKDNNEIVHSKLITLLGCNCLAVPSVACKVLLMFFSMMFV